MRFRQAVVSSTGEIFFRRSSSETSAILLSIIAICAAVRRERAEDQTNSSCQEHKHEDGIEETCSRKVNVQVHDDAGEDDHHANHQQRPAGDRLPVEEQNTDTKNQWKQRQPERVVTPYGPHATCHHDLRGDQVGTRNGHYYAKHEFANSARRASGASKSRLVIHCFLSQNFTHNHGEIAYGRLPVARVS